MLNLCGIVVAILKMTTGRNLSMSGINSGHHYQFLPVAIFKMATTVPHKFNLVQFQCPELIPDFEKFLLVSIFKMANTIPQKLFDFKGSFYLILNLCGIVVSILKMATGRNFSMSGINSGHHNLSTHEMSLKLDNVEFVRYCGGHFENGDR
jgi:putative Mn2+ efflux pump MntP